MLMPVEEIGLAPHPLREGIDLAAELVGDFSERQTAKERSSQHAADGRQLAARREARHQAKRVAAGEIEMHAEIGHAGELPQARSRIGPICPIGHRARGADAALAQEIENRGAHPRAQGEIIGTKDEAEHGFRSTRV